MEEGGFIYKGGPVATDAVIGLAKSSKVNEKSLVGCIEVIDLHHSPSERPDIEIVRLFVGYAGWSAGQLETELKEGSWFVFDAEESDVFTSDTENLWENVLRRQGGIISHMAGVPEDLAEN